MTEQRQPFVVITGGGTGGHITPALAVAADLLKRGIRVAYMGNPQALESQLAPQHGLPFYGVPFAGMPRKPGLALLTWLFALIKAIGLARQHLQQLQPDAVFGTGGYVAAPVLLAAKSLGIPYAIHEADANPGLVSKLTARWARHVTVAFDGAVPALPNPHITVTGNPVRDGLGVLTQVQAAEQLKPDWLPWIEQGKPVVLVMGGSQGARRINIAVTEALPSLLDHALVLHQTGTKLFEETLATVPDPLKHHPHYWPVPFIDNMPAVLSLATVVICRAGSLTLSELFVAGLPSILVPYPFAAANHQMKNAQAVQSAGAAWIIEDANLTSKHLIETLDKLLHSVDHRAQMAEAAKLLAKPHATVAISQQLCGLFSFVQ
jgi:UDP-N-acetylglucosamine--N-acetylmuramyl-(pentapeptide) pyrophosphoryl-undecaprenol N-acetylglucosamine transferase